MGNFCSGSDLVFVPELVVHCLVMRLEIRIEFEKVTVCRKLRFLMDVYTFLLGMAECVLVESGRGRSLNIRDMLTPILFPDLLSIAKLFPNFNFSTVINHL